MTIEPGTDITEERLFSLGFGLVYRWVCALASWDAARVGREATQNDPPGTSANRWVATDVPTDGVDASENPVPCNDCAHRRHWLINC